MATKAWAGYDPLWRTFMSFVVAGSVGKTTAASSGGTATPGVIEYSMSANDRRFMRSWVTGVSLVYAFGGITALTSAIRSTSAPLGRVEILPRSVDTWSASSWFA